MAYHPDDARGERYRRGLAMMEAVDGPAGTKVLQDLEKTFPDLVPALIEFGFGDIYTRGGLALRDREIAVVAALTALGTAQKQLKVHIHAALHVGCKPREIQEVIVHVLLYAGFPAALNGLAVLREAFAEEGIALPLPPQEPQHV